MVSDAAERILSGRGEITFSIRGTSDSLHLKALEEGIAPAKDGWWHIPIAARQPAELLENLRSGIRKAYAYGLAATKERGDRIDCLLEPVIQVLDAKAETRRSRKLDASRILGGVSIEPDELESNSLKRHLITEAKVDLYAKKIFSLLSKTKYPPAQKG
ncbi:hypothetical protein HY095_03210 [Candidatus Micrarchaeota archaeon]|nr:hypothetical protein [Candidatus Micrarchaeota archaeon]